MSRPSSTQTTPQFYRVSDRDLTEIELHSVDSINDLHRTHPEHSHKGKITSNTPSTVRWRIKTLTLTKCDFRNEGSSSGVHTFAKWEHLHLRHDSCQSKRPPRQQILAEPTAGHADAKFIPGLCHGLRYHHFASAHSVTHFLLLRWDKK